MVGGDSTPGHSLRLRYIYLMRRRTNWNTAAAAATSSASSGCIVFPELQCQDDVVCATNFVLLIN